MDVVTLAVEPSADDRNDVGADPQQRADLRVVQADLLDQLAVQRLGERLARLDTAAGERPADLTAGEVESHEQDPVCRVEQ